ncbi:hypothetical protein RVR_9397 [Actinacidiphila reveromycinica]|uniref:Uncharacterized protein n=1 Tax=Actinacidiphila reveromycinica TaxID=659352 RepID=A0A7U3UZQ1_9ACTN|nr:hypothetical protein RVR_9397 [Streptomyces sp. SN-593]
MTSTVRTNAFRIGSRTRSRTGFRGRRRGRRRCPR